MQCISTSGSRPATCGSGNVFPITTSTRTPSTTPTCWCGRRLYAPSGASPTSKPISAPVTAMPYCTGTAPRGAMSSRHGFLSAAVRRRPYGSGRRTRSLRAAGAGHSGVHTPQLPARGLPPLPAALLRVPSSVQLPPAGAVCRDDTLAGRPRGEGRRAGRARKPTFRTAKP